MPEGKLKWWKKWMGALGVGLWPQMSRGDDNDFWWDGDVDDDGDVNDEGDGAGDAVDDDDYVHVCYAV